MVQVPTPPPSRPGSEVPSASEAQEKPAEYPVASSDLRKTFDALLEQYLNLLDRQQELQARLSKQLSSGFLSLAHANYTSAPGRRYGADYYDERMKATRKISIQRGQTTESEARNETNEASTNSSSYLQHDYVYKIDEVFHSFGHHEGEKDKNQTPEHGSVASPGEGVEAHDHGLKCSEFRTHDGTEESTVDALQPESNTSSTSEDDELPRASDTQVAPEAENKSAKKFRSDDPIYWFGILVPPSLRNAQKVFTEAVQSEVPELAETIAQMRVLEEKITALRPKLDT